MDNDKLEKEPAPLTGPPCEGLTHLFFPQQGETQQDAVYRVERAKNLCRSCPEILHSACLEGAIKRREPWGVWGGEEFINGRRVYSRIRRRIA